MFVVCKVRGALPWNLKNLKCAISLMTKSDKQLMFVIVRGALPRWDGCLPVIKIIRIRKVIIIIKEWINDNHLQGTGRIPWTGWVSPPWPWWGCTSSTPGWKRRSLRERTRWEVSPLYLCSYPLGEEKSPGKKNIEISELQTSVKMGILGCQMKT